VFILNVLSVIKITHKSLLS